MHSGWVLESAWASITRHHRLDGINNHIDFSLGGWEVWWRCQKIQCLTGTLFLFCRHWSSYGGEKELLSGLFLWGHSSHSKRPPSSKPKYLLKFPPPNLSLWGLRFLHTNVWQTLIAVELLADETLQRKWSVTFHTK